MQDTTEALLRPHCLTDRERQWLTSLAERRHAGSLETADLLKAPRLSQRTRLALMEEAERFDLAASCVDECTGLVCAEVSL